MGASTIHQRYAKAFLDIGLDKQNYEQLGRELDRIDAMFASSDELRELMRNPKFGVAQRKAVLGDLLKRAMVSPLTRNFLFLLIDRNRIRDFREITQAYHELADNQSGRVRARVTVAAALSPTEMSRLKSVLQKVTGKQVIIDVEEDPSIIGGIVTHLDGKVYDGSVATQLASMKRRLKAATAQ